MGAAGQGEKDERILKSACFAGVIRPCLDRQGEITVQSRLRFALILVVFVSFVSGATAMALSGETNTTTEVGKTTIAGNTVDEHNNDESPLTAETFQAANSDTVVDLSPALSSSETYSRPVETIAMSTEEVGEDKDGAGAPGILGNWTSKARNLVGILGLTLFVALVLAIVVGIARAIVDLYPPVSPDGIA